MVGLQQSRFFSLRADGSTDNSITEQEAIYVHYEENVVAVNKFIGLEEVEHSTAAGVLDGIDNGFSKRVGVLVDTLQQKLAI